MRNHLLIYKFLERSSRAYCTICLQSWVAAGKIDDKGRLLNPLCRISSQNSSLVAKKNWWCNSGQKNQPKCHNSAHKQNALACSRAKKWSTERVHWIRLRCKAYQSTYDQQCSKKRIKFVNLNLISSKKFCLIFQDAGRYFCVVTNAAGQFVYKSAYLEVLEGSCLEPLFYNL